MRVNQVSVHVAENTRTARLGRFRLGFALLKNGTVPFSAKLFALAIGALGTLSLVALEVPLEGVVATLLPFVGMVTDLAIDGTEVLILPVVFAILLMPSLSPKPIVQRVRDQG